MSTGVLAVLRRLVPSVVAVVVLALAAYLVVRNAGQLAESLRTIGVLPVVGSGVLAVAGTLTTCQVWIVVLRGLGAHVPAVEGRCVFFMTQLGKYVPGSVWPALLQMRAGGRWGIARRTTLAANALLLVLLSTTGLIVGAAILPWTSAGGLHRYGWTLLLLVPLAAMLHPRAVPGMLDLALRAVGREALGVVLDGSALVRAIGWCLVTWVLLGLHLYLLLSALGAAGGRVVVASIGAMGLAWAAGLIVVAAPAGAGVRDVVLGLSFGATVGAAAALTLALTSRVLLILADVLLAAAGLLVLRTVVRSASAHPDAAPTSAPGRGVSE